MDVPISFAAAGELRESGLGRNCVREGRFEELVEQYRNLAEAFGGGERWRIGPMTDMAEARAAVLAVREVCPGGAILADFACGEDGRTAAGVDVLAALIVMQGMGVDAFAVTCEPAAAGEVLARLAPYATVPLMLNGEEFHAGAPVERDPDVIPCAGEKEARFLTPDVDVGETISCTPDLLEDILEAEERPQGALKIAVLDQDDLVLFAENQYAIRDALCLWSDVPELLEAALRVYQGRAFWDGTGDLEPGFLDRMRRKYGLVLL